MNENRPIRKLPRLSAFDYSTAAVYFLTFCTYEHKQLLGQIHNDEMILSSIGRVLQAEIEQLPDHFDIQIYASVIMPNHCHLLLRVIEEKNGLGTHSIPEIMCALRSRTTVFANKAEGRPGRKIWQKSYHDHIVRNESGMMKIWEYIENNPKKWALDKFYSDV